MADLPRVRVGLEQVDFVADKQHGYTFFSILSELNDILSQQRIWGGFELSQFRLHLQAMLGKLAMMI